VKALNSYFVKINWIKLGALLWIVNIQYFVVQILVILAWQVPFSWSRNTISDLGNTICRPYAERLVCSPDHGLMNVSFVLLGLTMISGSYVLYMSSMRFRTLLFGFVFMSLAGLGTILVGIFPENTVERLHLLGAGLPFLLGNLSLLIFGTKLNLAKKFKVYTLFSGALALLALLLFVFKIYLGLGEGGMERIVAYPQTIWMIIYGINLLLTNL
jgi:hypothetical membrane protein